MKVNIPPESRIMFQDNRNPFNGNMAESFNIDLKINRGKIGVTRTKKIDDFEAVSGDQFLENIGIIGQLSFVPFVAGAGPTQSFFLGTGYNSFFSASGNFVRGASSESVYEGYSDFKFFNGAGYLSSLNSIEYSSVLSGSWTSISGLTASTIHLLTVFGDRLYVTDDNDKVFHVTTSNVLNTSGTATLDLNMPGFTITALMSGLDRIWIGLSSTSQNSSDVTYIYEWDGESENIVNQKYEIDASGIICGVIKDGIPYILDTNGRILVYSGSTFVEVARLPYKEGEIMDGFASSRIDQRAIHPRGITVDQDEILINVSNLLEGSTTTTKYWADFPSGVWAYSQENGLYHKYSASLQAVDDTGVTNMTDYGQIRVRRAGGIFVHDNKVRSVTKDSAEGGRVIFAQQYFVGSDDDTESADINVTFKTGIFANDTRQDTQKWGYLITPEIHTSNITEGWQNIYTKFKPFLNSTDKIVVKYKTEKKEKTVAEFTFSDINIITSTADLSNVSQGDEIQIIQGYGSGKSFHVTAISESGGTYTITPDETFNSVVIGKTFTAEVDNWYKAGEINYSTTMKGWKELPLSKDRQSGVAQFKICMQFTGKNELYGITINSNKTI